MIKLNFYINNISIIKKKKQKAGITFDSGFITINFLRENISLHNNDK